MAALMACQEKAPPEAFPVDRLLTDTEGRHLDAEIRGRDEKQVSILRKSDQRTFRIPISQLSSRDRAFVRSLPVSEIPPADPEITVAKPPYVTQREAELGALTEKRKALEREWFETESDIRKSSLRRDLELLKPQIARLEAQIQAYWEQNGPK